MAGVLITGFEPFGGETVNPSWEVVKQLDSRWWLNSYPAYSAKR